MWVGRDTNSPIPLLLIPPGTLDKNHYQDKDDGCINSKFDYYHFYDFRNLMVTKILKRPVPGLPNDSPWIGSVHEWVAFMNPTNASPCLVNPFHHLYLTMFIYLLLLLLTKTFVRSELYIKKLAMSCAAPYDDNCIVVAIVGPSHDLAFCKPMRDTKWTPLRGLLKKKNYSFHYSDVIYSHRDQLFYATGTGTGERSEIASFGKHAYFEGWELNKVMKEGILIQPSHPPTSPLEDTFLEHTFERRYLVESSSGDLFHISRVICKEADENGEIYYDNEEEEREKCNYLTYFFERVKLDRDQNEWTFDRPVDETTGFFLGLNHSFSQDLLDGSIYFTYDSMERMNESHLWGGHDSGIDDGMNPLLSPSIKRIQPPPIWVNSINVISTLVVISSTTSVPKWLSHFWGAGSSSSLARFYV